MKLSNINFRLLITGLAIIVLNSCNNRPANTSISADTTGFDKRNISIPTVDISKDSSRHVIISKGTKDKRNGHCSTLLMPDGKTMFVAWTFGHGGPVGPLKKSTDGGLTWSGLLNVPENWSQYENCPPLYRLTDPQGKERLFIFANRKIRKEFIKRDFPLDGNKDFQMYQSISEDGGTTWSPMEATPLSDRKGYLSENSLPPTVMPFTAIVSAEGGKSLLGFTNLRRVGEWDRTNIIAQSHSTDGGLTWSYWRVILDLGSTFKLCEPEVIRSPDGNQLLMLIRENNRDYNSWIMISNNEGKTWSEPYQSTASVTMDRHQATYAPDGRLVIVGRDVAENSPTKGHFVAWVGTYDDLVEGREGQYRVKLLHTYKTTEYPGLEVLPDGTFVATNSVSYHPGENYSLVSTRFKLEELDNMLK
ncbi:exo-alpha-sialidase [Maribellus comscasis]|uniref:Exo-alpha-sialidase n=1 Tax=Maribellus comscasis TaxID=2681766 RepID=A0A6I6JT62_9BACT|nr:sialidase family protein [Maribellus comscasis]QGY44268.1 exo-alpha-sialidase [Maribellus comscasis]